MSRDKRIFMEQTPGNADARTGNRDATKLSDAMFYMNDDSFCKRGSLTSPNSMPFRD